MSQHVLTQTSPPCNICKRKPECRPQWRILCVWCMYVCIGRSMVPLVQKAPDDEVCVREVVRLYMYRTSAVWMGECDLECKLLWLVYWTRKCKRRHLIIWFSWFLGNRDSSLCCHYIVVWVNLYYLQNLEISRFHMWQRKMIYSQSPCCSCMFCHCRVTGSLFSEHSTLSIERPLVAQRHNFILRWRSWMMWFRPSVMFKAILSIYNSGKDKENRSKKINQ